MKSPTQMLRAAVILATTFLPSLAWGQSCSFSVSNMNFGSINTLAAANTDSTATLSINCSGTAGRRILICPHFGAGTGGASSATARQMLSGASSLNYQIYSNSGRTTVWGTYAWAFAARAPAIAVVPASNGTISASRIIYGRVFGAQSAVPPGTYLSSFTSAHVDVRYVYNTGGNCNTANGTTASPAFTVNATVPANCLITTQNVDFGSRGILGANIDAAGQVSIQCTPGNAYTVSLNGGTTGSPPTARKMSKGVETVTYGLYKDAARSLPWGDATTPGSTVPGTGNGSAQNLVVYGRVPAQNTPSPGVYNDTVVVTVTY